MIGEGNEAGNAVVQRVVDALLDQTKSLERAVAALDLKSIEFEGSDSLDSPAKVQGDSAAAGDRSDKTELVDASVYHRENGRGAGMTIGWQIARSDLVGSRSLANWRRGLGSAIGLALAAAVRPTHRGQSRLRRARYVERHPRGRGLQGSISAEPARALPKPASASAGPITARLSTIGAASTRAASMTACSSSTSMPT